MDSNRKAQFYFGKQPSKNVNFESSRSIPMSIKILVAKFSDKKCCFKVLGNYLIFFYLTAYEIDYFIVCNNLKLCHLGNVKRIV